MREEEKKEKERTNKGEFDDGKLK
jgi:hypothetical protein